MKKECPHGSILPNGLKCDRGYLAIRIQTPQGMLFRGCGRHTRDMERNAIRMLAHIREDIFLGTYNLPKKSKRLRFKEVAELWYQKHYIEYRDPMTREERSEASKISTRGKLNKLLEYFGDRYFDTITAVDVENYRDKRLDFDGVNAATFNREKGDLSTIFSLIENWIELKRIEPIKLPIKNPCKAVSDLKETPRDRVATFDEIRRLKESCFILNDAGMWDIIQLELNTTLRLGDLKKFDTQGNNSKLIQGKTKHLIYLPNVNENKDVEFINFRSRWIKVRNHALVADIQFRDLRRTGAHLLKKLGYGAALIKDTLGHKKESTTEIYLNFKDAESIRPLIEARKKLLDTI